MAEATEEGLSGFHCLTLFCHGTMILLHHPTIWMVVLLALRHAKTPISGDRDTLEPVVCLLFQ